MNATTGKPKKGARVTGTDRETLARDLASRYAAGASIRAIADETGRSYGFTHRVLTESGIAFRSRGSRKRTEKPATS